MEDLDELDAIFADIGGNEGAEKMANSYQNLPDGDYETEIAEASYGTSQSSGLPMITIVYTIDAKTKHRQYLSLANKDGVLEKTQRLLATAATVLRQLGLEATTMKEYVSQLDKLIGKQVTIKLETKNDYQRTHIMVVNGKEVGR